MEWFRMYHGVINDPKVQRLPIELRWRWVELLSIASANSPRGQLPSIDDITYLMRVPRQRARQIVASMIEGRLIDEADGGKILRIHDWDHHQRSSDGSADRVRRYRERHGNVTGNEDVTLQKRPRVRPGAGADSETEAETEPPVVPPAHSLGPEYAAVARYAEEQGGDVSWALWSDRMGRGGQPATSIRAAIDEAAGAGKLTQPYTAKILQRWAKEGPPKDRNGRGNGTPAPVEYFRSKGDHIHPKFRSGS